MFVYLPLLAAVTITGLLFCERHPSRRKDMIFLCFFSLVMFALSALRNITVGIDTASYCAYFVELQDKSFSFLFTSANGYQKEIGYSILNWLLSRISSHPYMLISGVSAVILILRAIFIWRYSSSVWLSVFVFISYGFFGYSLCTYRQEIAISIALFALPYLQKRRIIPFMLLVLLAGTFHKSLFILIPFYFIAQIPLNKITLSIYSAGTLFVLLFSEPILTFISKYIYQAYTLENYFTGGRSINTSFVPVITFIGVLFLSKRILERNPQNKVLINFCAYATFLFIVTLKHFIFQRIALIFLPAVLLLLPELLVSLRPDPTKYPELAEYQAADKTRQKQLLYRYTTVKKNFNDDRSAYSLALGTILTTGWIYYLFLLIANRLNYLPYVFMFTKP